MAEEALLVLQQKTTDAAWISGNVLVLINEVAQRRVRLVPGWVTVLANKPSWYTTSHTGLLSLSIPPWVGTMSTSKSSGVKTHIT